MGALAASALVLVGILIVFNRFLDRVIFQPSPGVDIRPEHDHTSVSVIHHGGLPDEFPIVQSATVRPGGAVNYLTVVTYV